MVGGDIRRSRKVHPTCFILQFSAAFVKEESDRVVAALDVRLLHGACEFGASFIEWAND
jgi:hypothetical protein